MMRKARKSLARHLLPVYKYTRMPEAEAGLVLATIRSISVSRFSKMLADVVSYAWIWVYLSGFCCRHRDWTTGGIGQRSFSRIFS